MFIVIFMYKVDVFVINERLIEHRAFLDECYSKNLLLASGPQNPRAGGVIIALASSKSEVMDMVLKDPLVIHDLVDFSIIEFNPTKYHIILSDFMSKN